MGDKSGIEWTDATWNWVVGCTPVSAGCDHCYAQTLHTQRHSAWLGGTFPDAPKQYHEPFEKVQLIPERLAMPLRWTKPRKIFVNSLADVFHKDVPDEIIDRAFAVMAMTPRHTFQVLTKRPQRMQRYFSAPNLYDRILAAAAPLRRDRPELGDIAISNPSRFPLPNVWLGVSVENQNAAFRIDALIQTPAAVRFLSCEPLIGPLDLDPWLYLVGASTAGPWRDAVGRHRGGGGIGGQMISSRPANDIHWVIAGGESGAGYRPLDLDWVRSLRDQCVGAGVPFLFKQVGGRTSKAGGRELDGRTWDEYPKAGAA